MRTLVVASIIVCWFGTVFADEACNCPVKTTYVERYAFLYVASEPPGASVLSTADGLSLSDQTGTPTAVLFTKSKFPYEDQTLGLLIYIDCFRPEFLRIRVNRWYRSGEEAKENPHQVRVKLDPVPGCLGP